MAQSGQSMSIVCPSQSPDFQALIVREAESKYMISGAADNTLRLWAVESGKCLYTWEFPTAVKRVAFSEDDKQVVCITEQRMGYQCAIRVFDINREDGTKRASLNYLFSLHPSIQSRRLHRIKRAHIHVQPHRLQSNRLRLHPRPQCHHHRSRIWKGCSFQRQNRRRDRKQ